MVLTFDGDLMGTVGGGCGEAEVYDLAQEMLANPTNSGAILHVDLTENPEDGGGKVCGGRFDVLLQRLEPGIHHQLMMKVVEKLEQGEPCVWATGFGETRPGFWKEGLTRLRFEPKAQLKPVSTTEVAWSGEEFLEPLGLTRKLIIVGAGHIARPLCDMAAISGYQVVVVDDRSEYAQAKFFPRAYRVLCGEYEELLVSLAEPAQLVSVVLVTRGHRHDQECLRLLAHLPLEYLGMIGSQRRIDAVFEELVQEGIRQEDLLRVSAPIGLEIGAQTPAEIAVSILAEMILRKRSPEQRGRSPQLRHRHIRSLRAREESSIPAKSTTH